MQTPPKWAQDLTLNALLWWEAHGNKAPKFDLAWGHSSHLHSSGWSIMNGGLFPCKVFVRQGKSHVDTKLVLLHEIAHQLADAMHTIAFYEIAWQLYRWAKLPIRYCQQREYKYMAGAQVAHRRNRRVKRV